ncbi:MAG: choice-of-anchor tandem repeat GloVer-containing protein [Bacteroidia bacterium]
MKKFIIIYLYCTVYCSLSYAQHYVLYGMTYQGGTNNDGVIFSYDPITGQEKTVFNFSATTGILPTGTLLQATNGLLYGITSAGGINNTGTIFSFNPYTYKDSVLLNFSSTLGSDGGGSNSLIEAKNGLLYGTTIGEGKGSHEGTLFNYNINTNQYIQLYAFDSLSGNGPSEKPIEDTTTGVLYGLTEAGGMYNEGVLYEYNTLLNKDSVLVNLDSATGDVPTGSYPLLLSKGILFGVTFGGGINNRGAIFSYNINSGQDTVIHSFDGVHGESPVANNLILASNGLLYGMVPVGGTSGNGVLFSLDPSTDNYNILVNFTDSGSSGNFLSYGYIMQDPDNGIIYGTTVGGGTNDNGVIFSYNITTGVETVLYKFSGPDGSSPYEGMTLVKDTMTGIAETYKPKPQISIYPNPNSGIFTISMRNATDNTLIEIYNMLGQNIYQNKLNTNTTEINLSGQPTGIYLYRVVSENEKYIGSGKLLIEN